MKARKIPMTAFEDIKIQNAPTYRHMLRIILDAPLGGQGRGITTDELIDCVRLANEIEQAPDTGLLLEKKDWEIIVRKLNNFQWPAVFDKELVGFIEAVRNAPEVEVNE